MERTAAVFNCSEAWQSACGVTLGMDGGGGAGKFDEPDRHWVIQLVLTCPDVACRTHQEMCISVKVTTRNVCCARAVCLYCLSVCLL